MSEQSIWESDRGTFIRVIVKPNSKSKEFVSELTSEAIHLNLKEKARDGKANTELVKRIAKNLGVPTERVTIVAGHRGREKTILIANTPKEIVFQRLSTMI